MNFEGATQGFDYPVTFVGVYERSRATGVFEVKRAYMGADRKTSIPAEDFAGLVDPYSPITNEKLLVYALPGLKRLAASQDPEARQWLGLVLEHAEDTPEKLALQKLLAGQR